MDPLADFETVADPSAATAGAPTGDGPSQTAPVDPALVTAGGETETSAVVTEPAPVEPPQHLTPEDAAAIADARFQQLLEQARNGTPVQQQPGDAAGFDPNAFLDPYGENFGQNLLAVLSMLQQQQNQALDQRFQPFQEQAQQAQAAELDDLLKTAITETATGLGGLRGGDAAIGRVMADVRGRYMPEATRIYGHTDKAAQVAIEKAIRAERDYQNAIAGGAAVESAEHLAAVAGARTDLAAAGSGSGVVTLHDGPRSSRERIASFASAIQSESQAARSA